jgi:hypothetical protein
MSPDAGAEQGQGQQQDESLEKLGRKLASAAGTTDLGALKGIVEDFYRDAVDLRVRNREVVRERDELKKRLPKEGDVVLSGEDAKSFAAIQKLGVPLKDVSARLESGARALEENAGYKQGERAQVAADLLGWNPKILNSLVKLNRLNLDFKEEVDAEADVDATTGRRPKKKIPVVIVPGDGEDEEDEVPLAEYVDEHLGDFRDALAGAEAARKGEQGSPSGSEPANRMIRQRSGEQGRTKGMSEAELDAQLRKRHSFRV